jgi:pimeloyl-ACP methyl ester carboxylesterase/DNA-binding CsgD family transcriptional regulator
VEEQAIRFTTVAGRRIAWATSGSGPPLILAGWWMSRLELNWRDPRFRAYVEALGRQRTVIRYDPPDCGEVDEEAAALAAVVEAFGPGPIDLIAGSSGAPIGVAYAVAHPERLRRLVFYGGYADGSLIADQRSREAIVELVRGHWGLGSRALADVFLPSATAAEREEFVAFQRQAADAERAARSLEAVYRFDVTDRLAEVAPGAVVLHRRDDRAIPFAAGRELAAGLPGATFVALDGDDHYPWFGDSEGLLAATFEALGIEGAATPPATLPPATAGPEAPDPPADPGELTRRETEVLALVAAGLSDREIAERLVLSPHTVHRHVANVRTKLGLPTRAAAVAAAAKRGLL